MQHIVATIALAPVLLWQGRQARAKVPRLPEPSGQRSGMVGTGTMLRVLIVGDSAAAGVGATTQAEALSGGLINALQDSFQLHWKLIATTGHTTANALEDLQAIGAEPYDVIITSLGVNDVTEQHSLRQWRAAQTALLALLQSRFEARHIFVCGLPPMHRFPALPQPLRWYIGARARQFDSELQALTEVTPQCEFVPLNFFSGIGTEAMASDGFHPGPAIYRQWAEEIAGRIRSQFGSWC